jgi:hypothetical protein
LSPNERSSLLPADSSFLQPCPFVAGRKEERKKGRKEEINLGIKE